MRASVLTPCAVAGAASILLTGCQAAQVDEASTPSSTSTVVVTRTVTETTTSSTAVPTSSATASATRTSSTPRPQSVAPTTTRVTPKPSALPKATTRAPQPTATKPAPAPTAPLGFKPSAPAAQNTSGCTIKGNIASDGEKIYHVPGQRYYEKTKITLSKGERWFCSAAEAEAAGWRAAKV